MAQQSKSHPLRSIVPSTFDLTIREPKSTWPPDRISIRLGEMGYTYNPDADGFPKDSPCSFKKLDDSRDGRVHSKQIALKDKPYGRAQNAFQSQRCLDLSRSLPVVSGPTNVKIGASRLVCATPDNVKIRVKGRAEFGFTYGQLLGSKEADIPLPVSMPKRPSCLRLKVLPTGCL